MTSLFSAIQGILKQALFSGEGAVCNGKQMGAKQEESKNKLALEAEIQHGDETACSTDASSIVHSKVAGDAQAAILDKNKIEKEPKPEVTSESNDKPITDEINKDDKSEKAATAVTQSPPKDDDDTLIKKWEIKTSRLTFSSPTLKLLEVESQLDFLTDSILRPFLNPKQFNKAGIKLPTGIICHGNNFVIEEVVRHLVSELSAKTLTPFKLLHPMSCETGCYPYNHLNQQKVEKYFDIAIKCKPSVLFLSDLQSISPSKDGGRTGCHYAFEGLKAGLDKILPGDVLVIGGVKDPKEIHASLLHKGVFDILPFKKDITQTHVAYMMQSNITKSWQIGSTHPQKRELEKVAMEIGNKITTTEMEALCTSTYKICIQRHLKEEDGRGGSRCTKCKCGPDMEIGDDDTELIYSPPTFEEWMRAWGIMKRDKDAIYVKPIVTSQDKYVSNFVVKETKITEDEGITQFGFAKVGGLDSQIKMLKDNVLAPLKNAKQLKELGWGVEPIKGILFHGPSGTGKTLLAKALAEELSKLNLEGNSQFSLFYHKATDCLCQWVGATEAKLREIFEEVQKAKPAILFFDEFDGLFSARSDSTEIATRAHNGVITTMLGLMDDVPRGEVFVIAATNMLDNLDPAIRRPGRFDRSVEFHAPMLDGRRDILGIHTSSWKSKAGAPAGKEIKPGNWASDLENAKMLDHVAEASKGMTGAELEQLCRETFTNAMKRCSKSVSIVGGEEEVLDVGQFEITSDDWSAALKCIRPMSNEKDNKSCADVLLTERPVPSDAAKILKNAVDEISTKLADFLKLEYNEGNMTMLDGGLNTFLIWGSGEKQVSVVSNLLLPLLLSSAQFKTTVATCLDLSKESVNLSQIFRSVVNPGEGKLGILIIQGVERLMTQGTKLMDETQINIQTHQDILTRLERLRGENVLILGTSSLPPSKMSVAAGTLFKCGVDDINTHMLKAPDRSDISIILQDIEVDLPKDYVSKISSTIFPRTQRDERVTADFTVYDLLDIKAAIQKQIQKKGSEDDLLVVRLDKVLKNFMSFREDVVQNNVCSMYT